MSSIQSAALVGNLAFTIVCLVVGIRLLILFFRSRQLPELLLGGSFLAAGLSLVLSFGRAFSGLDGPPGTAFVYLLRLLIAVAAGLILVLAWRVFRPSARWATVLVILGGLGLVASVWNGGSGASDGDPPAPAYWIGRLALILPYVWAATEAYRYQRDLRLRQSLGLAPKDFLATRLSLWSAGLALSALLYSWLALAQALAIYRDLQLPTLFATSGLGLSIAVCFWLAFFPPRSWVAVPREGDAS